jgi:hypothetical protein
MRHFLYLGIGVVVLSIITGFVVLMVAIENWWKGIDSNKKAPVVLTFWGGILVALAYGIGYAINHR